MQYLSTVLGYFQNDRIRRRILNTLFFLCIYRLVHFIPIWGVNLQMVADFLSRSMQVQGGTIVSIVDIFSDGALRRITIFAVGIVPYISSTIIFQILSTFIPKLRYLLDGTEDSRNKYAKYVLVFAIILATIQSLFISLWLEVPAHFEGLSLVAHPGWGFRIVTTITLTAVTLFIIWLSELITLSGIGNGIAVLMLVDFSPRFIKAILQLFTSASPLYRRELEAWVLLIIGVIFIGLLGLTVTFTEATRKIFISFKNSTRKEDGNYTPSFPLRFNLVGTQPFAWAQYIIFLPATTFASFAVGQKMQEFVTNMMKGAILYNLLYVLLIFIFTYLYTLVVFQPHKIARDFKRVGAFVSNLNSSKGLPDYLDDSLDKITLLTAIFLSMLALCPEIIMRLLKTPYLVSSFLGGTSILIIAGAVLSIKETLDFYLLKSRPGLVKIYSTFDESEAILLKEFINYKGTFCELQPMRFIWGLPVRTNIDRFILYVAQDNFEQSRHLLKEIQNIKEGAEIKKGNLEKQTAAKRGDCSIKNFIMNFLIELKEISWPDKKKIIELTGIVIVIFMALTTCIGIIDSIFLKLVLSLI